MCLSVTQMLTSVDCYLHKRRYIEEEYDRPSGEVSLGHVTNYAQNVDGLVWNLEMLEQHLGVWTKGRAIACHTLCHNCLLSTSLLPQ